MCVKSAHPTPAVSDIAQLLRQGTDVHVALALIGAACGEAVICEVCTVSAACFVLNHNASLASHDMTELRRRAW